MILHALPTGRVAGIGRDGAAVHERQEPVEFDFLVVVGAVSGCDHAVEDPARVRALAHSIDPLDQRHPALSPQGFLGAERGTGDVVEVFKTHG